MCSTASDGNAAAQLMANYVAQDAASEAQPSSMAANQQFEMSKTLEVQGAAGNTAEFFNNFVVESVDQNGRTSMR